ncbi:MAG TPA: HD domain-containing protein [Candidatus Eremiobacteraeota bacterium]|nr:MAG: Cyclic di-GMP phosphodiesterase response regulator RpfG [bacterium ADurb.Bin363]HPZ09287.1 HD domain-containing protein [Candidatus Eremiobacteraeota bacterium]
MNNKSGFEMATNIVRFVVFVICTIFYFSQVPGGMSTDVKVDDVKKYFSDESSKNTLVLYIKQASQSGGVKVVNGVQTINKSKLIGFIEKEGSFFVQYAPFYNYKRIFQLGIIVIFYIIVATVLSRTMVYHPGMSIGFASMDFVLSTLFIFFTGGIKGPFILLYVLIIVHVAAQFGTLYSVGTSVLTLIVLIICSNFSQFYAVNSVTLINVVPFGLFLGLTGFLVGSLYKLVAPVTVSIGSTEESTVMPHMVVDDSQRRLEEITKKYQAQTKELQRYAGMEENFRRKQREFRGIHEIIQEIVSEVDIKKLLPLTMTKAAEECEARVGAILLKLSRTGDLRVYERYNLSPISEKIFNCKYGEGIIGSVALKGEPLALSKTDKDPRFSFFANCPERIQNFLCVPMTHKGQSKGVILLCNKLTGSRFSEDDERSLSILAGIAATAIANAELFKEIANKNEELGTANRKLEDSIEDTITTLAEALDAKDSYTREHSKRICKYAVEFARYLNLDERNIEIIRRGSLLHDIGKIGIPDRILFKPEGLTDDEFTIIKSHVIEGAKIISKVEPLRSLCDIVKYHHEKFDGSGYPNGLKGDEIPIGARIVAVVDTYDAMTTDRPYRKGFTPEVALEKMAKFAPNQVGMDMFLKFEKMIREKNFFRI